MWIGDINLGVISIWMVSTKTMKLDEIIKDVNVEKEEKRTKTTLGYSNIKIFGVMKKNQKKKVRRSGQ